ncbi:MAG TPA: hypothetical protein VFT22_26695, partial [Kofleriaceae bacterium]|nr:hypothetical protein [Kofleriaceae bacterium]
DEILKAAEEPPPVPPPRPSRPTPGPPLGPFPQARSGEFGETSKTVGPFPQLGPIEAVPSMIVQPGSSRVALPPPPAGVLDLSANVLPDSWMADPSTDLLRGHRIKSVRNAAIALGALILIALAIFFLANRLGDSSESSSRLTVPPVADAGPPPDAPRPPIDAAGDLTRDEIIARSRFGFFSINATAKTQIYIDNKLIGDTPLTQLPLPPGPHKVKAMGPRSKVKQINIVIYGGQDTDEGTITW